MTWHPDSPSPFVAALADLPPGPRLTPEMMERAAEAVAALPKTVRDDLPARMAAYMAMEPGPEKDRALLAIGRTVHEEPTHNGMMIRGRVITNLEMSACRAWEAHVDRENIRLYGCCGRQPNAEGNCFGNGKCPRVLIHDEVQS